MSARFPERVAVRRAASAPPPRLLRAARSPKEDVKLAVVHVLTGVAKCGDNMSAVIQSGAMIFLMGCTYTGHRLQLAVAKCLEGLLTQVYEGATDLTEKEANMLAIMSALEARRAPCNSRNRTVAHPFRDGMSG